MLTSKQRELLRFIQERLAQDSVPPSFDEMKDALQLKSKSGIHRLITALEERGFIRRLPNRARAIEVIRLPPDSLNSSHFITQNSQGFTPSVVVGGLSEKIQNRNETSLSRSAKPDMARQSDLYKEIPIMGRIAAGTPISAIQHQTSQLAISSDFLSSGEHYALEVHGDSMINAGIHDGDLAIIRKQDTANSGEIIVALIDDEEATLKRFRKKGSSIALEAANPAYETRVFGPDRVAIQGRLVSLIRRY